MNPEEFISRNINLFLSAAGNTDKNMEFGVSYIQRVCKIGYNQACHTRDKLIDDGVIETSICDHRYIFICNQEPKVGKGMTETVEADLNIELVILCPDCDEWIDLMRIEGLNDEGQLTNEACPGKGNWTDSHPARFFDSNENALEDMKALAEKHGSLN